LWAGSDTGCQHVTRKEEHGLKSSNGIAVVWIPRKVENRRMGIIVSRRRRRGMAQPSRPDPLPQSQPENQEPSTATQEDVLRSNDDGNESDPGEKSDVSDERDSESSTNDEGSHESEPDEHNQSESSQSVNSNESAKDVSMDTAGKSETIATEDTTEVDEFNNDWKKVFLEDLNIKISDNVKIVRIFTSSTFTGIMW